MDGTICDHDQSLFEGLEALRGPKELVYRPPIKNDTPEYIKNRADLIRASESWWENLPRIQLGWNVLKIARELDYRIMILTQGPKKIQRLCLGRKNGLIKI